MTWSVYPNGGKSQRAEFPKQRLNARFACEDLFADHFWLLKPDPSPPQQALAVR
jgi:hypothetical protein